MTRRTLFASIAALFVGRKAQAVAPISKGGFYTYETPTWLLYASTPWADPVETYCHKITKIDRKAGSITISVVSRQNKPS